LSLAFKELAAEAVVVIVVVRSTFCRGQWMMTSESGEDDLTNVGDEANRKQKDRE